MSVQPILASARNSTVHCAACAIQEHTQDLLAHFIL